MNNLLEYKDFKAKIEFSADDNVFFGTILGIEDFITFESETVEGLKDAFKEAVEFHIELCEETGKEIKKSYSGKVFLRLPEELHARIAETARAKGKSINEFGIEIFESAV